LGQKQRVAILRAICQPFEFILLDEPTSHLDIDNSRIVLKIVLDEIIKQDAGLILTSLSDEITFNFDNTLNL